MRKSITAGMVAIAALGIGSGALAEIYQSKDAQGNTVFSDTPTQDAEVVELGSENIADAVTPRPPEPEPAQPAANPAQADSPQLTPAPAVTDDDDELREEWYEEQRRDAAREALRDHAAGEGEVARPLPATRPHPGGVRGR
ncbi:MAG: hypothetical protein CME59_12715 [Halioglobus sp.]|mgnify:CR=1 FL=1|nr:hypothetical protein [Halioglobus sp.]|tara:strand:- start:1273 stop:1695 length:423 start_codon:yes stop_codon:yes gene_type:complete